MTYKTAPIKNYIIKNQRRFKERPSPAHVQNILYYAHGIYLAKYNQNLLKTEFAATKFGAFNLQLDTDSIEMIGNKEIKIFLNKIIISLSNVKEEDLSRFIRQKNSPWQNAITNSKAIDNDEIRKFFLEYISNTETPHHPLPR